MDKAVKGIINLARLAPSAHNTQPWYFKVSQNKISLYMDESRSLGYSDPDKRETYLSLGACLGSMVLGAKAYKRFSSVNFNFNAHDKKIADLPISKKASGKINFRSIRIIKIRQTNRGAYEKRAVPKSEVLKFKKIAKRYGVGIRAVNSTPDIDEVSNLHYSATRKLFADSKFREELSGWVRHNLTTRDDGIPGYSNNMPLVLSFFGPFVIKNFDIGIMQGMMEKKFLAASPLILVFSTKKNDRENWLKAGMAFEEIAVEITKNGLAYAPFGAIIESEAERERIKELFVLENPVFVIRVGYPKKKYKYSPKRSLLDVIAN